MEKKNPNIIVKLLMLIWHVVSRFAVWLWTTLYNFFARLNYRHIGKKIVTFVGNFFHWLIFKILLPKKYRGITKRQIYRIIFKADTPMGKKFDVWLLVLIGLNLMVIMLDSFEAVHSNIRWVLKGLEWINSEPSLYRNVTTDDIRRVASSMFSPQRLSLLEYEAVV